MVDFDDLYLNQYLIKLTQNLYIIKSTPYLIMNIIMLNLI